MNRLSEITQRLSEIEVELRKNEISAEDFAKLQKESNDLLEERAQLTNQLEQRSILLNKIAAGAGNVKRTFKDASPTPTEEPAEARELDKHNTMEYRRAFMDYVLRGTQIPIEFRTDAITSTSDAGAVIPTTVVNKIVEKLEATGMILPLITRTSYKGGVQIPTSSVKPSASWVNEGAGSDKQSKTVASDATINFTYHKLRCAVATTLEVNTISLAVFEAQLIKNVVDAMTKAVEQAIISGDGSGKPTGILSETPADGQTIEVITPSYDDLLNAEAALPIEYEANAVYCMSKKTFMEYFGLRDSNGQPIGRINYGIAGKPERMLLGRPVVCCNYVSSYASTLVDDTPFAFLFDFKDYILNTNYELSIKKYEDNNTDDLVTKAIMLVDGKVVDKNSLVVLVKAS